MTNYSVGNTIAYKTDDDAPERAAIVVAVREEQDGSSRYDLRVFDVAGAVGDISVAAADLDATEPSDPPPATHEGTLANEGGPGATPYPQARS